MREILFRGKTDKGEWAQGYYVKGATRHCIVHSLAGCPRFDVIPETVGQYTGLTDKNGTKIFEGDILADTNYMQYKYVVVFDEYCRYMITDGKDNYLLAKNNDELEVIGNKHDNPELLEQ